MVWWILGGTALLFLLFCLLRLGIRVVFGPQRTAAWVTVGPVKVQVAPSKTQKVEKKKPRPKKPKQEPKDIVNKLKTLPKPTLEDVKSAVRALSPACKRALRRTRRGVRIHPLRLSVTIGGAVDAAGAAEWYGYANAGVWTVMPALEQLLVIPEPQIHIGLDFDQPTTTAEGEFGLSIRIGTLIALGLGMGIPALRWFLSWQKQRKQQAPPKPAETEKTAA